MPNQTLALYIYAVIALFELAHVTIYNCAHLTKTFADIPDCNILEDCCVGIEISTAGSQVISAIHSLD